MEKIESLEGRVAVTTLIAARPETVFGILSTPEGLSTWLDAEVTFEATVGAPFSILFTKFQTTIAGAVLELVEGRRIALSWGAEDGPQAESMPVGSTRVIFDLAPEAGGTRITISHEELAPELEDGNRQGWRFLASRLNLAANRSQLAKELPETLDTYFRAWTTDDDDERRTLLGSSCTDDVAFMDEYAALTGRDTLAQHASNTRQFFPGSRIQRSGEVAICRGEVLVPFEVVDAEGIPLFGGTNYFQVSNEGLLERVTGFWGAALADPGSAGVG